MANSSSMRAVKGSLGHSPNERERGWKALARAKGTSQEIDCEAIGGQGGWKMSARGWVRKLRAVGDQSGSIPGEITSELGGNVDK